MHRVINGKHYRQGECYKPGDLIEPTAEELRLLKDRFEPVDAAPTENAAAPVEIVADLDTILMVIGELKKQDEENPLGDLLDEKTTRALDAAGIHSMERLAAVASDPEALAKIEGIGKAKARKIRERLLELEISGEKES